ncbi:hypothetical protein AVEN_248513-1 [Araneus ventricosus]|uniref:Uncharacterized protein n=1 Tax=Araneus ventricosus TaxID=182803 RepID=A0A4Y2E041_ARAVE|nr:hypothetical protein AVEN_248513-1 [Araneus ventricosus]
MHGGSSVESGFGPEAVRHRRRDLTIRPPRPHNNYEETEALDFLWTSDESDLHDIDNELVILTPDPDAMSDTEDTDYLSTRKIEETMCDGQCITDDTNLHYIL